MSTQLLKAIVLLLLSIGVFSQLPEAFDYVQNFDPTIRISPRYAQPINFVGEIIDGYKNSTVIISNLAGQALAHVQQTMRTLGYSLVIYDGYRPQKAVDHFYRWSLSPQDSITKSLFYPYINKSQIIPQGYVAIKSGHTRGSTVDLTIIPLQSSLHELQVIENTLSDGSKVLYLQDGTLFMCTHFDYFGPPSHQDTTLVTPECLKRRNLLRSVMKKFGFRELHQEWWHFTLQNEPFPNTYFDFDII